MSHDKQLPPEPDDLEQKEQAERIANMKRQQEKEWNEKIRKELRESKGDVQLDLPLDKTRDKQPGLPGIFPTEKMR